MSQAETRYDVSFGDVRDAQIVIGDHTTVVTPDGVKVVRIVGDARPTLRPSQGGVRPALARPLVGRDGELELARRAAPGWPLQLFGQEGIGKTSLLKHVAAGAPRGPVVYAVARRRSLDDLEAMLFRAFWETEERYVPAPDQMPAYLADREATVVLDDVPLDRDDLDVLLDAAPRCAFVLASTERTLWGRGASHEVPGLGAEESVELIERELGRRLGGDERAAAVALAAELDGRPQSLVELAALVLDRQSSLVQLAADRAATAEPPAGAGLSAVERRVLGVLGSLSGAALGAEHVGALAAAGDARALLGELERSGWVKSQSPRYRLARSLPANAEEVALAAVVEQLAEWARRPGTTPDHVAGESEAIEAVLERALREGRHDLALALAWATESKLATSGLLGSWARVVEAGIDAARAAGPGRAADEAYMLHQLGSRAIGVHAPTAREHLTDALSIRERLGDERGADLTRHNLAQLGGGGTRDPNGNGRPRRPRLGPALGGLLVLAALGVGVALLAHGGGSRPAPVSAPVASTPRAGHRPTIAVAAPKPGARYGQGRPLRVAYTCKASADARPVTCSGTVDGAGPVPDGGSLLLPSRRYELVVRARDRKGRTRRAVVPFEVIGRGISPDAGTSVTGPTGPTGPAGDKPGGESGDGPNAAPALPPPSTPKTVPDGG